MLQSNIRMDKFYNFTIPITAVYISDEYIANDKTVPMMMSFFPNSPYRMFKLCVEDYTSSKFGHMAIFRKQFERELWPELVSIIERPSVLLHMLLILTGTLHFHLNPLFLFLEYS